MLSPSPSSPTESPVGGTNQDRATSGTRVQNARLFYHGHPVQVGDVFECGGRKLATVDALDGKVFMGGDKWPVRTSHATVPVVEIDIEVEL